MQGNLYYAVVLCGVCILAGLFLHAYIENMASLEERERIIGECNSRIQAANTFTAKCMACLYANYTVVHNIYTTAPEGMINETTEEES